MKKNLVNEINNAESLDDKANIIADIILTYRKNVGPVSINISSAIFNSGLSKIEQNKLLSKVHDKVVSYLGIVYPNISSAKFSLEGLNLNEIKNKLDKNYLNEKKWQKKPYLFRQNLYVNLNLLEKRPLDLFPNNTMVNDVQPEVIISNKEDLLKGIRYNYPKFYINNDNNILFSTVTTETFEPVLSDDEFATQISEIKDKEKLYDITKFDRKLDICTYVVPQGNLENSINIIRYDGTGFPHKNQVFYDEQHREVFGEWAKVPHFHFQNHVENLLYLKKSKNDAADFSYMTAGCNAIDCEHLINYLKHLDATPIDKLEDSNYGMPFLYAKKNNIPCNLKIKELLIDFTKNYNASSLNYNNFIQKLYEQINTITSGDSQQTQYAGQFTGYVVAFDVLDKIHEEINLSTDKKFIADLTNLEIVCANEIVAEIGKSQNPFQKQENLFKGKK